MHIALGLAGTQTSLPLVKIYCSDGSPDVPLVHSHLDFSAHIFQVSFIKKNKHLLTLATVNEETFLSAFNAQTGELTCFQSLSVTPVQIHPSPYDPDDFTMGTTDGQVLLFKLDTAFDKFQ